MTPQNPYADFLDTLEKPARYIGGEHYVARKSWDDMISRVAICFPDTYEIGMSHLGMKVLYDEINQHEHMCAERCFAPWGDLEKEIRERDLNLVSLENFRALKDFHVVGFSLQYEMSYTNILNMLDLGGVSVWQKDRTEDEPFVICGGPCATHPEPLAPFMDFVVVGDGEKLFARICHFIGEARGQGMKRLEILRELSSWQGIYVPSFYTTEIDEYTGLEVVSGVKDEHKESTPERVERFFVDSLKEYPFPTRSPIPHMTAIFDRFSVELARGCTEGCRFCQAGMIYRPVRERSPRQVVDMVMDGLKSGGFNEASLTCLSTADYSAVTPLVLELLDKLAKDRSTLGISSLRAYGLDNRILDKLAEVKNSSLTFAPEAGSQRMRDVINKNVSQEDLMQTARDVFSRGWKKMKLYFMIGLPTETDEDVRAIMETARDARLEARKVGVKAPAITVSASSFVPKPHTPFQWASMITMEEIQRKQHLLSELSKEWKLNFRKHYSKISYFEGVVARGDRRIAQVIFDAWSGGARFDGWDDQFKYNLWFECLEKSGINVELMLGTIPMRGKLPWDHIDVGLEPKFLEREWLKATKNRLSPPCGKVAGMIVHHSNLETLEKDFDIDKRKLVCYHCGVACDLGGMVEERREFLQNMDAIEDVPYERPEVLKKDIAALRDKRGQQIGHKYRIEFSKVGPLSFISHLDLQKVMARIFKRAGVEVLYSEGYKSRPLLSFGPALTLGISSLSEFFDVRVPEEWSSPQEILVNLQEHSERGIHFRKAFQIDKKSVSIQESTRIAKYFFPVKAGDLESAASNLIASSELMVDSFSKKEKKMVQKDLRPMIVSATPGQLELDGEMIDTIHEVSSCKDLPGIHMNIRLQGGSGARPSELLGLLKNSGLQVERPIKTGVELV